MKFIRKCPFSGALNVRDIDVSEEELSDWNNGTLIQIAMPDVTSEDREFIQSGITPEMWNNTFGHLKETHEDYH